ncbi:DUF378 domain-containing protein [Ramlibacter humi]|uniref:DUF378 domain-containing protein n=1 Tax=Ramlibacter humi TaxID=2530451 RepID=A0A4Z0BHW0_9BURK|nr:DUF378 domain-containing protein [Ramlibacter humi]TFY98321.1 DUF378 domain-containing protein [Ramlibacter humi]
MAESDIRAGEPRRHVAHSRMNALDWIALVLMIIGGLNWGLVGLFNLDVVATLFGQDSSISRVIYVLVGLAALWGFVMMRLGGRGERY